MLLAGPRVVSADPTDKDEAEKLAAKGDDLVKEKRFDEAVEMYKQAAAKDPSPAYVCNIGMAYYATSRWELAHLHLTRCNRANDGSWPQGVGQVNEYVEKTLKQQGFSKVRIQGKPSGAQVDIARYSAEGPSTAPFDVYLPAPGKYVGTVSAAGYEPATLEIDTVDRSDFTQTYALAQSPASGGTVSGGDTGNGGVTSPANGSEGGTISGGTEDRKRNPKLVPWLVIGAGGVTLAVAGGFFMAAYSKYKDLNDLHDGGTPHNDLDYIDVQNDMVSRQKTARILGIVGGVVAGVGIFMLWRASGEDESVSVSAAPSTDGGMVLVRWTR